MAKSGNYCGIETTNSTSDIRNTEIIHNKDSFDEISLEWNKYA